MEGVVLRLDTSTKRNKGGKGLHNPVENPRLAVTLVAAVLGLTPTLLNAAVGSDTPLQRRIAELSLRETDDARFRHEVERLVGLEPEGEGVFDRAVNALSNPWVIFGLGAQALFMMRFVVQWIVSERRKRSVVPVAFWWLSLMGGLSLFTYAVHRRDPVFVLGQGLGCAIYIRNLVLIYRRRTRPQTGLQPDSPTRSADAPAQPNVPQD